MRVALISFFLFFVRTLFVHQSFSQTVIDFHWCCRLVCCPFSICSILRPQRHCESVVSAVANDVRKMFARQVVKLLRGSVQNNYMQRIRQKENTVVVMLISVRSRCKIKLPSGDNTKCQLKESLFLNVWRPDASW